MGRSQMCIRDRNHLRWRGVPLRDRRGADRHFRIDADSFSDHRVSGRHGSADRGERGPGHGSANRSQPPDAKLQRLPRRRRKTDVYKRQVGSNTDLGPTGKK